MKIFISFISFLFFHYQILSQDLTVATFNCEWLIKDKIHFKLGVEENTLSEAQKTEKFEEACEVVAGHIKTIDADIIGLTEVGDVEDLEVLLDKLRDIDVNYPHVAVAESSDHGTGQHVAVLSMLPLSEIKKRLDGRTIYFSELDMDESFDTGISKGMKVSFNADGKTFDLYLAHFISETSGYKSDAQRLAQAETLRRHIITSMDKGRSIIVMGDFNTQKKMPAILRMRGFDDIYPELIQSGDDDYFKNYNVRWTYNYKGTLQQIDHILLSMDLKNDFKTEILLTPNSLISDHNAVVVDFDF